MERYINGFATENDIQIALENGELLKPYVAYIEDADRIDWNSKEIVDYTTEYLTFNILSAGTINWTANSTALTKTIEYKLNDGGWTSITSNTGSSAPTITVNSGDKIQFRGNNTAYGGVTIYGDALYNSFKSSTALFEAEGNIMSLVNSTGFATATTLSSAYTFQYLFFYCTGLTSAEHLILPATTLTNSCYKEMFGSCTSLASVPELPASTLTDSCYSYMFSYCSSLTTAPELPATTLANHCYSNMFQGCTKLTTAPKLPATALASSCYSSMFNGCISLTTAPVLPATTLANNCYQSMFWGCTSLTTAPELPVTTLADYCYANMFQNCTSLTQVPALPATTLANHCYSNMFQGCTSLTTAPVLPATTLVDNCYSQIFRNCTSLNYIKCLATDISAYDCTWNWTSGVASTGTFVKNPNMTSWTTGDNGIPTGWTVQDA